MIALRQISILIKTKHVIIIITIREMKTILLISAEDCFVFEANAQKTTINALDISYFILNYDFMFLLKNIYILLHKLIL